MHQPEREKLLSAQPAQNEQVNDQPLAEELRRGSR
jgi:hypothetical protein